MERRGWNPGKGQPCHQMLEGGSDGSGGGAVKGWGQVPRTPPCPGGERGPREWEKARSHG